MTIISKKRTAKIDSAITLIIRRGATSSVKKSNWKVKLDNSYSTCCSTKIQHSEYVIEDVMVYAS